MTTKQTPWKKQIRPMEEQAEQNWAPCLKPISINIESCFAIKRVKYSRNKENNYQKQECLVITKDMVSKQSRKIPNWKAPGRDGV